MKKAVIFIGHQYTGKSTAIRNFLRGSDEEWRIYSLDLFVHQVAEAKGLTYDQAWKTSVDEANKLLNDAFHEWLQNGENIIFDRTNMKQKARLSFARRLVNAGYHITVVQMKPLTDEEILRRIELRPEQKVPFEIVKDFRDRFEPIDETEAKLYNEIETI